MTHPGSLKKRPPRPISQKKSFRLPRTLDRSIEAPAVFRAGLRAELQKFGREDEPMQLALFGQGQGVEIKTAGLDLSISEDKALTAVQKLLDRTDYKGNAPGTGKELQSTSFKWSGHMPRLSFTWPEYYEAYGLKSYAGKYTGAMVMEARKALLEGLTKQRYVCYERKRYEGTGPARKQLVDIVRTTTPLVKFCEFFEGLTVDEASRVEAGEPMTERVTRIVVEPSPLLLDGIENYFLLKPATLHQEIAQLTGGKKASRAVSLFIEWLLTLNLKNIQISKDKLAIKLRQGRLVKQRKTRELDTVIQECLDVARRGGWLLDYSIEAGGLFSLRLNPARCSRVKLNNGKAEAQDEEDSN